VSREVPVSTPRQAARGRRPGTPDTREEILRAARELLPEIE